MSGVKNVLVINATGRQGWATCEALVDTQKFKVFGTTRKGVSSKLADKGVQAVKFQYGDAASCDAAIKEAGAELVWFTTLMGSRATEAGHGKIIVDACKRADVKFVCFSSVAGAEEAPDAVAHFKSKFDIENHLKASGLPHAILRPVAFFENFDDAANWNPLKKGSVKCLWPADLKVKMVSTKDIGKAGAVMLQDPQGWQGKTLDCASDECNGSEVAKHLTDASGVECTYSLAVPRWILWMFMNDLYNMVLFFESTGFSSSIPDFKKVVPDAMGARQWLDSVGQWSSGEKFNPRS